VAYKLGETDFDTQCEQGFLRSAVSKRDDDEAQAFQRRYIETCGRRTVWGKIDPAGAVKVLGMVEAVVAELPPDRPRYFMGQGFPDDIADSVAQGVDMFDCVMPTRNARKGTVFTSRGKLVVKNAAYATDDEPLDPSCDCYACTDFSRGYLRHLFNADEMLAGRLATLHNLTFYVSMMRKMRTAIVEGRFGEWRRDFFSRYDANDT